MLNSINECSSTEGAGLQALRRARERVLSHIGSASKELGDIAAQYGRLIDGYKIELAQLDDTIAQLTGKRANDYGAEECSTPNKVS